jgi:hypothetical protein
MIYARLLCVSFVGSCCYTRQLLTSTSSMCLPACCLPRRAPTSFVHVSLRVVVEGVSHLVMRPTAHARLLYTRIDVCLGAELERIKGCKVVHRSTVAAMFHIVLYRVLKFLWVRLHPQATT